MMRQVTNQSETGAPPQACHTTVAAAITFTLRIQLPQETRDVASKRPEAKKAKKARTSKLELSIRLPLSRCLPTHSENTAQVQRVAQGDPKTT
ncbi:predicted protein [Pyrenophora tritici-repentis Pt-1C-BFP]|uniref:Uncharacterized protein n=1 Tax=Pyrenophora tritici-repentis (strain Pt-1C-BFP) TaxID=426418 RepID=B2WKT7_PYRTR|nr:uncharacterized protein PTRG_10597 [Pyrenophora tritici-repentis Pt-1C-BFP]EDU43647.1 predicted protein [Pyrenophora tritici-repentis Pt-1C-BFP]